MATSIKILNRNSKRLGIKKRISDTPRFHILEIMGRGTGIGNGTKFEFEGDALSCFNTYFILSCT